MTTRESEDNNMKRVIFPSKETSVLALEPFTCWAAEQTKLVCGPWVETHGAERGPRSLQTRACVFLCGSGLQVHRSNLGLCAPVVVTYGL